MHDSVRGLAAMLQVNSWRIAFVGGVAHVALRSKKPGKSTEQRARASIVAAISKKASRSQLGKQLLGRLSES